MGLCTIADIELAFGEVLDDDPMAQFLIDSVSAYIETFTGQKFEAVTDQVIRCQADGYGIIEFKNLTDVSEVNDWKTGSPVSAWAWDGVRSIYNLDAHQVVDATVSYGWSAVPDDIVGIVVDLVGTALGLSDGSNGGLRKLRIGDREETYGITRFETGKPVITITSLMSETLYSYKETAGTFRIAAPTFPKNLDIPTL